MYTDQTGAFPVTSIKGNRYVMVATQVDGNVVISETMKNRIAGDMIAAYRKVMRRFKRANIIVKKHILDNEISEEFKEEIENQKCTYELVPKGMHRRNMAERAIQTWKAHAIGVLCGLPSTCPLGLWCQLLPQIDMQVNMLRQSNTNPNVCAWTVLQGAHDFNRHPLAPLGIEMHMLTPAGNRRSWGVKIEKCFYI